MYSVHNLIFLFRSHHVLVPQLMPLDLLKMKLVILLN